MTWRDELARVTINGRNLIGASFRGVPFFVDGAERSGGRRTVIHEIPFSDDPTVLETGRRPRPLRIEGYVLGDDCLDQKNALLEALEDVSGPGLLIHPYYGAISVICDAVRVQEEQGKGRIAMFSLDLITVPASQAPLVADDPTGVVDQYSDSAVDSVSDRFVEDFDTDDLPSHAVESASGLLENLAESMDDYLGPIVSGVQEGAQLFVEIQALSSDAGTLIASPYSVISQMAAVLVNVANAGLENPLSIVSALLDAAQTFVEPSAVVADTPIRIREAANQAALSLAMKSFLAIEASRQLVRSEFETISEARRVRDRVADFLDELSQDTSDDSFWRLQDLRAAVVIAVPGDAVLARLKTITLAESTPSLVESYRLYGSADRADEIVARNQIAHPGFIPGDQELEILSSE